MSDIMDYCERIDRHSVMLDSMAETHTALTDRLAVLERVIKSVSIDYLIKNPDSKSSIEKVEMLALVDDKTHRKEYEELTALRIVVKAMERRMDLVERQMNATQSVMRWNDDRSAARRP